MQTIITKACNELEIKPVPSKRVSSFVLRELSGFLLTSSHLVDSHLIYLAGEKHQRYYLVAVFITTVVVRRTIRNSVYEAPRFPERIKAASCTGQSFPHESSG